MLSYRQRLRGEYVGVPTQDVNIFFIERPSRPKTSLIPHADGTGVGGFTLSSKVKLTENNQETF